MDMMVKKSSSSRAHHHQSSSPSSSFSSSMSMNDCHHQSHIVTSSTHISSEAEGKTNTPLCHSMPVGDSNSCYSYSLAAWCISYFFLVFNTFKKHSNQHQQLSTWSAISFDTPGPWRTASPLGPICTRFCPSADSVNLPRLVQVTLSH